MTFSRLIVWIVLVLVLQLSILGIVLWWRYWQQLKQIKQVNPASNANLEHFDTATQQAPITRASHNVSQAVSHQAVVPLLTDTQGQFNTKAWNGLRAFVVERKVFEDKNQSICSFYLKPQDGLALAPYFPGQFLSFNLEIPLANSPAGTEKISRCYSLSDTTNPEYYRVSIKRNKASTLSNLPDGKVSNYFHDHIQVGDVLSLRAPSGQFYLTPGTDPVVLIAGGIGITPMLSMLQSIQQNTPHREVFLFYGSRDFNDVMQLGHFLAIAQKNTAVKFKICLSNLTPLSLQAGLLEWPGIEKYLLQERISLSLLRQSLPFKPLDFYICGPSALMESLVPELESWGVPANKIHFEAFGPASVKRSTVAPFSSTSISSSSIEKPLESSLATSAVGHTQFIGLKSGKQLLWEPHHSNILDLLESHGIVVNSACREGNCGSCQTKVLAGEVVYESTPDYSPEAGSCLVCVGRPKANTSVVLDIE